MALQDLRQNLNLEKKDRAYKAKESIDPLALQTLNIDRISVNIAKLLNLQVEGMAKNQELLKAILQELKDDASEGEVLAQHGTVVTNDFTIIETEVAPNHPVKGYSIKNDGPGTLFVAHNISKAGLQPDIDNINSAISRFNQVLLNEAISFEYNRRKILNVAIIATGGNTAFRGWLTW